MGLQGPEAREPLTATQLMQYALDTAPKDKPLDRIGAIILQQCNHSDLPGILKELRQMGFHTSEVIEALSRIVFQDLKRQMVAAGFPSEEVGAVS